MSGDPVVMQAIATVRGRYSSGEWATLLPSEVSAEIYREIRRLDLLRVTRRAETPEPVETAA